ncbi:hypothetical protein BKA70DRAFT_1538218 [Coprinopsis sp. MPI-PUGE-AT-0042]|nr:hypothetical protein BKA70DRAFT_1538218 [Coprinopsis sp. MPI-PUGE-AT-0042]
MDLPGHAYFQNHPSNKVIVQLSLEAYRPVYDTRTKAIEEEEHAARFDTPISVCVLAFPGMPTALYIFEPGKDSYFNAVSSPPIQNWNASGPVYVSSLPFVITMHQCIIVLKMAALEVILGSGWPVLSGPLWLYLAATLQQPAPKCLMRS